MFKELNNLRPFLEDPGTSISVRQYAQLQDIAPATASAILKNLEKQQILVLKKVSNLHFYALSNSQVAKDLKVFMNVQSLRSIITELNLFFGKPTIVLFGSASNGEDVKNSDFDLYIESEVKSHFDCSKLEKKLGRPLQLFVYSQLSDVPNEHLKQNIINGIILQGELKWI